MAKLSSKQHSKVHRVLIFGPPKAGKTELAGKLSEHYNVIWVDMENGHETLFKFPQEWQDRIELVELKDTRSYPIAIETALKMVKGPVSICNEHGKVGCMICKKAELEEAKEGVVDLDKGLMTDVHAKFFVDVDMRSLGQDTIVVFDSLTQLTNSAIANITKNEPDDYKLTYDDWGNLGKLLDIFLSHIQQASCNVIVISHEVESETEGGKKVLVPVGGTRNFSRNVAKYFDHVVYMEKKNRKHVAASSTLYSNNILTGSRTDATLETDNNPSLLRIFKPELFTAGTNATETKTTTNAQTALLERMKSKLNK